MPNAITQMSPQEALDVLEKEIVSPTPIADPTREASFGAQIIDHIFLGNNDSMSMGDRDTFKRAMVGAKSTSGKTLREILATEKLTDNEKTPPYLRGGSLAFVGSSLRSMLLKTAETNDVAALRENIQYIRDLGYDPQDMPVTLSSDPKSAIDEAIFMIARNGGAPDAIIALVKEYGGNPNEVMNCGSDTGLSAAHIAAKGGKADSVRALKEAGANFDLPAKSENRSVKPDGDHRPTAKDFAAYKLRDMRKRVAAMQKRLDGQEETARILGVKVEPAATWAEEAAGGKGAKAARGA